MPLIETLLLLLILSRVLGEIAERYRQPGMLGEIAAGIVLGPSVLNVAHYTPEIRALADIGVLLLVFLAGMEMELGQLWASVRGRGAWVSITGFVVPLVLGLLLGFGFGMDLTRTVFLGLCVAITALPVSARILMDLNRLQSEVGQKIISASVANDVASLLLLGIILDVRGAGSTRTLLGAIAMALTKALVFMVSVLIASRLIRRLTARPHRRARRPFERLVARLKGRESMFAVVFLFVMAFGSFSEWLGLNFVVGAFFGSMLLSYALLGPANYEEIRRTASNITMGFLGPIFFAAVGLEFDAHSLRSWGLVVAVLLVAFAGKIAGGYLGGRLAGMTPQEAWALGVGLNGRGIMELVIANIALERGFIGPQLFSILVLMAVVTTFATPFLLKWAYQRVDAVPAHAPTATEAQG